MKISTIRGVQDTAISFPKSLFKLFIIGVDKTKFYKPDLRLC